METETPRRWMPVAWLDEMNTCLLATPDAFIRRDGEGWLLRLPDDHEDAENEFYRMRVEPGQIVNFTWTESFGDVEVTVRHDGTWSTDYAVPEGATHFYAYAEGIMADSLEELVDEGDGSGGLEPGTYEVSCYTWSETILYRFEVDASGAARFVQCPGAN